MKSLGLEARLGSQLPRALRQYATSATLTNNTMSLSGTEAWDPTFITGNQLWVRSDRGVTSSGGLVSNWADQSGHGNDYVQATDANKPTITANVYTGKPAITGNGTSNMVTALSQVSPASFYVVCSKPATLVYIANFNGATAVLANYLGEAFVWLNGSDTQFLAVTAATGLHMIVVTQTDASSLKGYTDSASPAFSVTPASPIVNVLRQLWASSDAGDIVEAAAWNKQLSDGEVAMLHNYSQNTWGTP